MRNQNVSGKTTIFLAIILGLLVGMLATYQYAKLIQNEQNKLLVGIRVNSIFDDAFIRLDQSYEPYGDQVKGTSQGSDWYENGGGKFSHEVTVSADSFLKIDNFKNHIQYALINQLTKTKDYFPEKWQLLITEKYSETSVPEENKKRYSVYVNVKLSKK